MLSQLRRPSCIQADLQAQPLSPASGQRANTARRHAREYLERLDARLQACDWLADERSIADPYLFVLLRWTIKLDVDSSGLDNLARFLVRMYTDTGSRSVVIAEEGHIDGEARLRSRGITARS